MMGALYEQFDAFMDFHANRFTKEYKFQFSFEGTDFSVNREVRLESAMTLFDKGVVLPQKIAAAIGMKPAQFRKHMEESLATDFMSLLTPPSVETQERIIDMTPLPVPGQTAPKPAPKVDAKSGETSKRGRPQKRTSTLGEEGMKSRETGTNVARGGKI